MRKTSSQWEFGDLFEGSAFTKTYSVTALTKAIKQTLEKDFGRVRVSGEISNFRSQSSGHSYFGLKDSSAQISCVLFRGERVSHRADLENGTKILLEGDFTVYEARGQYQIVVRSIELLGIGALQQAFEKLKSRLKSEGLFDASRKRPIPFFCFRLGILSSSSGAALRDVCRIMDRRNPSMNLLLVPVRVQGQGAADEIAKGIEKLNRYNRKCSPSDRLQAILITRGGGSLEDLWAFNEEILARAIAASKLPIISAVGHEIDFTICDFIADLRASTPSAAAELITEGIFSTRPRLLDSSRQMRVLISRLINHWKRMFEQMHRRLEMSSPKKKLGLLRGQMNENQADLHRTIANRFQTECINLERMSSRLSKIHPAPHVDHHRDRVERLSKILRNRIWQCLDRDRNRVEHLSKMLHLLSPLNILERGYSITRNVETGEIIRSTKGIKAKSHLRSLVFGGEIVSEVIEVQSDEKLENSKQ